MLENKNENLKKKSFVRIKDFLYNHRAKKYLKSHEIIPENMHCCPFYVSNQSLRGGSEEIKEENSMDSKVEVLNCAELKQKLMTLKEERDESVIIKELIDLASTEGLAELINQEYSDYLIEICKKSRFDSNYKRSSEAFSILNKTKYPLFKHKFSNLTLKDCDLSSSDLTNIAVFNSDFRGSDFRNSCFSNTNLYNSNLLNINLTQLNKNPMNLDYIKSIAVAANERFFVTASRNGFISVYEFNTFRRLKHFRIHTANVHKVLISYDNSKIISLGSSIKICDVESGELLLELLDQQFNKFVAICQFHHTPRLLSACMDIKVWDLTTGNLDGTFGGNISCIRSLDLSSDDQYIIGACEAIMVWSAETRTLLFNLQGEFELLTCAVFSPCEKYILAAADINDTSVIQIWDYEHKKMRRSFLGHSDTIYSLAFSQSRNTVISCGLDYTIREWDFISGECVQILHGHYRIVYDVKMSSNFVVSGSDNIKVWKVDYSLNPFAKYTNLNKFYQT